MATHVTPTPAQTDAVNSQPFETVRRTAEQLPIGTVLDTLRTELANNDNVIVEAPPGAGKTTIIPLALLTEPWLEKRRIVMLQPRRVAAKAAATRMASLLGEEPGQTVGYRMRLESRTSRSTRIEVVTEGVLLRMLTEDPSLDDVGLLIFDEFHERSLDGDLGLALARYARATFERDTPLKLLVMSATLDMESLAGYLDAPTVRSEGRSYAVDIQYQAPKPRERLDDQVQRTVERALHRHPDSSLLVFLPGQGEIQRIAKALPVPPNTQIHPLLGSLSLAEQQQAIAPAPTGQRKVVLATNIAETSLTIDGVHVVIDSGLERRPVFDPTSGMSRLHTVAISQASATQRAGRAGRLAPGTAYRLWSEHQQQQRPAQLAPEIDEADLAPLVLQLFAWGIYDPAELDWLSPPPAGAYAQARDLLERLGAIDATGNTLTLSDEGFAMAGIATHPRLAHMLLAGGRVGALREASLIAAVLSDRDPVDRESPDMSLRLDYLNDARHCPAPYRGWRQRTLKLAEQLRRRVPQNSVASLRRPNTDQLPAYLLACAFPERIARRRHNGGFQLANGRSARFADSSSLDRETWLAVAEVGGLAGGAGATIRSAAALDPTLFDGPLKNLLREEIKLDWDKDSGRFIAERRARCGALVVQRQSLQDIPDELRINGLLELIRDAQMSQLNWNAGARSIVARAQLMERLDPSWPGFDETTLMATLQDWLGPFLSGVKRLGDLKKIDLRDALKARLSWDQQQALDRLLPTHLTVPSGSCIAIDYAEDPPVLAVKLQEMFGATETPVIGGGRIALKIHLLSPAGRPLQVTQNLETFWDEGYGEVRKEMRGRYPKHPWPENPREAEPTRHTKRRQSQRTT